MNLDFTNISLCGTLEFFFYIISLLVQSMSCSRMKNNLFVQANRSRTENHNQLVRFSKGFKQRIIAN
jgi:hypothetical protein